MYRVGSLRRVFRARGKLVGTSDFVVTRGYVQIRVVGFPSLNVTDLRSAVVADAVVGAGRLSRRASLIYQLAAACVEKFSRRWFRAGHCVLSPPWLRRGALLHRVSSHRDATPSELWGARALGSRRDKAVDEFVEFVLCSLSWANAPRQIGDRGLQGFAPGVEEVNYVAPRATVAIQASQKVLAQLLTLTGHGTEEPHHRHVSSLRLRRTVPYRRDDETDADDARCH